MYTIIAGTNRIGSNTLKVAKIYKQLLIDKGINPVLFSLEDVGIYQRDAAFEKIENDLIIPTKHFIFIIPEYNGSFPGVLKTFIDTSKSNLLWWHKRALITGVSTGRAGNLRGIDHLTGILNHLKINVHHNLIPISSVDKLLNEAEQITDELTLKVINKQLDEFIQWCS